MIAPNQLINIKILDKFDKNVRIRRQRCFADAPHISLTNTPRRFVEKTLDRIIPLLLCHMGGAMEPYRNNDLIPEAVIKAWDELFNPSRPTAEPESILKVVGVLIALILFIIISGIYLIYR